MTTSINEPCFNRLQEAKLKAARMHIFVRRGGPNYQKGLAKMRSLGDEIGVPIEVCRHTMNKLKTFPLNQFLTVFTCLFDFKVYGPEATMTGICKEAIQYITAAA